MTTPNETTSRALARTAERERPRRVRRKCDPKVVTAARELRDRWLDAVNAGQTDVALPAGSMTCVEKSPPRPR